MFSVSNNDDDVKIMIVAVLYGFEEALSHLLSDLICRPVIESSIYYS